jgi:hypothetical protein
MTRVKPSNQRRLARRLAPCAFAWVLGLGCAPAASDVAPAPTQELPRVVDVAPRPSTAATGAPAASSAQTSPSAQPEPLLKPHELAAAKKVTEWQGLEVALAARDWGGQPILVVRKAGVLLTSLETCGNLEGFVEREGELHVFLSWVGAPEGQALYAGWCAAAVASAGTARAVELEPLIERWANATPFHDAKFTRFGLSGLSAVAATLPPGSDVSDAQVTLTYTWSKKDGYALHETRGR